MAAAFMLGFVAFADLKQAEALPAYTKQTGLACGRCHANPAGGGKLTAFGEAFAANGHKVASAAKPAKPSTGKSASTGAPAIPAAEPLVVYDYARARAWSLRHPYYSQFLYSPEDYRN
jgi:hypothetical protein